MGAGASHGNRDEDAAAGLVGIIQSRKIGPGKCRTKRSEDNSVSKGGTKLHELVPPIVDDWKLIQRVCAHSYTVIYV